MRKLLVLFVVGVIFLVANIWCIAHWLARRGFVDFARNLRRDYLTGTALAVIFVLLVLLVRPRSRKSE